MLQLHLLNTHKAECSLYQSRLTHLRGLNATFRHRNLPLRAKPTSRTQIVVFKHGILDCYRQFRPQPSQRLMQFGHVRGLASDTVFLLASTLDSAGVVWHHRLNSACTVHHLCLIKRSRYCICRFNHVKALRSESTLERALVQAVTLPFAVIM